MVTEKAFTTEKLKGIKYVVVGLTAKADKKGPVIAGYFLGLRGLVDINVQLVNKNDLFVWLMKGEEVQMLNLSHYEIKFMEININGSYTKYSAYKEEVNIERLTCVQEALKEYDMLRPNGLIDTDGYTNVPEATKKLVEDDIKPTYKPANKTTSKAATYNPVNHAYSGAPYHNRPITTYKKKEIETFVIRRTTKYPISSAIERMKTKIEAIKEGTYKAPKLAEIPADKEPKEGEKKGDKSETTDQAHMEEVYGYSGYAGL
ncbi:hypothetical protein LCGC14_0797330 [marine sediment metagenome]|uniref:Uncharacterized protein n=1 Tax=marine sediment metagenome TaxID=412755 RepID=A0A0F9QAH3_9ZZZZ